MTDTLKQLLQQFPRAGRVQQIVLRPTKRGPCVSAEESYALLDQGLEGDHRRGGPRQVSLIQAEHLPVIAALSGHTQIDALDLRRNLVIAGINLIAFKSLMPGQRVALRVGEALIEINQDCDPCSRMEAALGPGGYNAMRGHGGVLGVIIEAGKIRVGDVVSAEALPQLELAL